MTTHPGKSLMANDNPAVSESESDGKIMKELNFSPEQLLIS
jgi:hypothetical protein